MSLRYSFENKHSSTFGTRALTPTIHRINAQESLRYTRGGSVTTTNRGSGSTMAVLLIH